MTPTKFAIPSHSLFPIDTPENVSRSAFAIKTALHRMPVDVQLDAARKITAAALELGVSSDDIDDVKGISEARLSPTFVEAMSLRHYAISDPAASKKIEEIIGDAQKTASMNLDSDEHGDSKRELMALTRVGVKISSADVSEDARATMLDSLCRKIAEFDQRFLNRNVRGIPSAVDTVFRHLDDGTTQKTAKSHAESMLIGGRIVTQDILENHFDKKAAAALLSPSTMEKAASIAKLKTASREELDLVATFLDF